MMSLEPFLEFMNGHWMVVSFLAPLLWALVNVIDVYFVDGVYDDELDGTIISGLFQIVPWCVLIFFLQTDLEIFFGAGLGGSSSAFLIDPACVFALAGGFLFTSAFYFYFKALFNHIDVALLQIIWSLTIIFVPLLSYLFWNEKLSGMNYLGMGITLFGVIMLTVNKDLKLKLSRSYSLLLLGALAFLSLSMVFEDKAYAGLDDKGLAGQAFLVGFLFFSLGAFLGGIFFAIAGKRNPLPMIKKHLRVFLLIEGISFLGTMASQKAISIAPSVSFVATIETFVPVFILLYCLLIVFYLSNIARKKTELLKALYQEQLSGIWFKMAATVIMAVGVYLVG